MEISENLGNVSELYGTESDLAPDSRCKIGSIHSQPFPCYDDRQFNNQLPDRTAIQSCIHEDSMSFSSSSDDPDAATAVFQHLDGILRQRVNVEVDVLKESIHRILADQQLQFKQAFGLPDTTSSSSEAMHVVPQSNYCDDPSSEECLLLTEGAESDTSDASIHRNQCNLSDQPLPTHLDSQEAQGYNWEVERINHPQTQSRDFRYEYEMHKSEEEFPECRNLSREKAEEVATLKCLVRMLTASAAISTTLRRREYEA